MARRTPGWINRVTVSDRDPDIEQEGDRMPVSRVVPTIGLKPDLVVVGLPTALAIRVFNPKASLLIIGLLVAIAFIRKPESAFRIQAGPLLVLFGASAIVACRPEHYFLPMALFLVGALVLRLVMTVDARRIIASLIDGLGLYLIANALGDAAGIRSPSWNERVSNLNEATGFTRTVFPLASSLNAPSIVAGAYLVAAIFLLREAGWVRRSLRLICSAAAIFVIVNAGTRNALAVTVVLSIVAVSIPFVSRWIAQAATVAAAISAFVLSSVVSSIEFAVKPLTALASGRVTTEHGVVSLQGREQIWTSAIKYWNDRINDVPDILLGFGEGGQYRSGASLTYISIVRGTSKHPEFANVHNSFLQQLFDGGVLGWFLLVLAVYWASVRLSKHRREWGHWGLSAVFAMTAMLLGNTTEATMAPGVHAESFWLLVLLVGIACQASASRSEDVPFRDVEPAVAHKATGIRASDR